MDSRTANLALLGATAVSLSITAAVLLGRQGAVVAASGRRDETLERFCNVLRELPDEDWAFVKPKLDGFMLFDDEHAEPEGVVKEKGETTERNRDEECGARSLKGNNDMEKPAGTVIVPQDMAQEILKSNQDEKGSQACACEKEKEKVQENNAPLELPQTASPPSTATEENQSSISDSKDIHQTSEKIDNPALDRFRKMLKVGINPGAVRQKMLAENLNPDELFGRENDSDENTNETADLPPPPLVAVPQQPSVDPAVVERFSKMLKVGIHPQAVKLKMAAEGLDPSAFPQLFGEDASKKNPPAKVVQQARKASAILKWEPVASERITEDSLWADASFKIEADMAKKIENLFKAPKKKISRKGTSQDENQNPNRRKRKDANVNNNQVLPARRAQNLQIGFAKFKLDPERICDAVYLMEADVFGKRDDDNLQLLLSLLPTEEEMNAFRAFSGEESALSDVERLFRLFSLKVPDVKSRVESMIFVFRFPMTVKDIHNEIELIIRACNGIIHSKAIANLLRTILGIGLAITSCDSEKGFSIHGLGDRLLKTKTGDGKLTCSDVVAGCFRAKFPGEKLPLIEPSFSQFPSLISLENEIRDLKRGIERRANLDGDIPPSTFVQTAEEQVASLTQALNELKEVYSEVLVYFGEPKDRPLNTLFQDIANLVGVIQASLVTSKFQWSSLTSSATTTTEEATDVETV